MKRFQKSQDRKKLLQFIKKEPTKDVSDWCSKNFPCPAWDIPQVTEYEFSGNPPRISSLDVDVVGYCPFSFAGKDVSECVMHHLDMRSHTLAQGGKEIITRDISFEKATCVRTSFKASTLVRVCFVRANCELAVFDSSVLREAIFTQASLRRATFTGATLEGAVLRESIAAGASFNYAHLEFADLTDSWMCNKEKLEESMVFAENVKSELTIRKWESSSFVNAHMRCADMRRARLCGCDFTGADLSCAALQEADLRGANFLNAKLCGANLSRANLQGARNLLQADLVWAVVLGGLTIDQDIEKHKDAARILSTREAVEKWAQQLSDVNLSYTDLSEYNMAYAQLVSCIFKGADLRHTILSGANLSGADFGGAEMYSADLTGANLTNASFLNADMRSCNMSGIDLTEVMDKLLEAKTLMGATCTLGNVPEALKSRGVIADRSSLRINVEAAEQTDAMLKERKKREMEEERRLKEQEYQKVQVDKIESMIHTANIVRLSASETNLFRFRLVATVLKERQLNFVPVEKEEKEERWDEFNETFGLAHANPVLKKLYLSLIGEDVQDDWLVQVWRRIKDLKVQRLGTLEMLCLQTMLMHKEWSEWVPAARQLLETQPFLANTETASYVYMLLRTEPDHTSAGSLGSGSGGQGSWPGAVQGSPESSRERARSSEDVSRAPAGMMPGQQGVARGGMVQVPAGAQMQRMSSQEAMMQQQYYQAAMMRGQMQGNVPGQLVYRSQMGGQMMPVKVIRGGQPQLVQMGSMGAMMGRGTPNYMQRVKCVECGMVMETQYIAIHKRECRMRMVSCAVCKYSMRYILWDSHNKYCNTSGQCPVCKKNIKENLVVHLYSKHTAELVQQGFFKGVEPPVKPP